MRVRLDERKVNVNMRTINRKMQKQNFTTEGKGGIYFKEKGNLLVGIEIDPNKSEYNIFILHGNTNKAHVDGPHKFSMDDGSLDDAISQVNDIIKKTTGPTNTEDDIDKVASRFGARKRKTIKFD